jgi:hypothetical protein
MKQQLCRTEFGQKKFPHETTTFLQKSVWAKAHFHIKQQLFGTNKN